MIPDSKFALQPHGMLDHTDLPPQAAGRHVATRVPTIHPTATIADVEALLLKQTRDFETINYIYVIDASRELRGVLSVKEVFRLPKETPVARAMKAELITARPHTDERRVALLALEHHLKEIPVVDAENRFLGVVPSHTILEVLHEGMITDTLYGAGVHRFKNPALDIIQASVGTHLKKRLPWLLVGLLGGTVAAFVVSSFEATLASQILLASFIPAVVYMADAVGTQTETIFVRSLGLVQRLDVKKYLFREIRVVAVIAVTLAVLMAAVSYLLWGTLSIALILGLSFFTTTLVGTGIALLLPWMFTKFGVDPAFASGPFATVLTDILSLLVYLAIAAAVVGFLA